MGSKRSLLRNGLGDVIAGETSDVGRVVDLFCGSAAVSWFASVELGKRVLACDLQEFAVVLAGAVVTRKKRLGHVALGESWLERAKGARSEHAAWSAVARFDRRRKKDAAWHRDAQQLCGSRLADQGELVLSRYGGHYFSPAQALSLDSMLSALPEAEQARQVCLAATIVAASRCAAAPGHTAQPFKSTATGSKYLHEAWSRDPFQVAAHGLKRIAPLTARRRGATLVGDANKIAAGVESTDLVFVDPPYSAVQYSRFYHVLETIARGTCGEVTGTGRYPPRDERPRSQYSRRAESAKAITGLLETLSKRRCKVILTFPLGECSNGMSGKWIEDTAKQHFKVSRRTVTSRFSTLGGNTAIRDARKTTEELILVLRS